MEIIETLKDNIKNQIYKSDWGKVANNRYSNPYPLNKKEIIYSDGKTQTINNVFVIDSPLYEYGLSSNPNAVIKYLPLDTKGKTESHFYNHFSGIVGPEIYEETILIKEMGIEILMESGVSLKNLIELYDTNNCETAVDLAYESARMLGYMEMKGFIHGDIKPENILLVNRGIKGERTQIILTDFEHTVKHNQFIKYLKTNSKNQIMRGTRGFIPPEIFNTNFDFDNYNCTSFDIFSYGCLLYDLINRNIPRRSKNCNIDQYIQMMTSGEYFKENYQSDSKGENLKLLELMLSCTEQNPNMRPSSFTDIMSYIEEII